MRLLYAGALALFLALSAGIPAAAAAGAASNATVEVAVTYAHGGIDVFEIATAKPGSLIALPISPQAERIEISGGKYSLSSRSPTGETALVQSAKGTAQATYRVPYPASGIYLFVWHTPVRIARAVLLTGPQVNPSGLGIAPFTLGGQIAVGGKLLTSFSASNLPAGYTARWPFEVGSPGVWLGNVFTGIALGVPALAVLLGLRTYVLRGRRRAA